jgi:hypothetical protein
MLVVKYLISQGADINAPEGRDGKQLIPAMEHMRILTPSRLLP